MFAIFACVVHKALLAVFEALLESNNPVNAVRSFEIAIDTDVVLALAFWPVTCSCSKLDVIGFCFEVGRDSDNDKLEPRCK